MNEELFNLEIRKFLKQFGVTAQRETELAIRAALEDGRLATDATVPVRATLEIGGLDRTHVIEGAIRLE